MFLHVSNQVPIFHIFSTTDVATVGLVLGMGNNVLIDCRVRLELLSTIIALGIDYHIVNSRTVLVLFQNLLCTKLSSTLLAFEWAIDIVSFDVTGATNFGHESFQANRTFITFSVRIVAAINMSR